MNEIDRALRETVAGVIGRARQPFGRSLHVHQLDGARTEAMIHLDEGGAWVEWVHGKGDCAVTGEGAAILDLFAGVADVATLEHEGRLVLYGDRQLISALPSIFRPT